MSNEQEVIEVSHITVEALPGSALYKCQKAAVRIAVEKDTNIVLKHNGKRYMVQVEKIWNAVEEIKLG